MRSSAAVWIVATARAVKITKERILDHTFQGRKRGAGSAAKLILALIAGVALGALLSDRAPRGGAQQAPYEESPGTFLDSLNADAAP